MRVQANLYKQEFKVLSEGLVGFTSDKAIHQKLEGWAIVRDNVLTDKFVVVKNWI